MDGLRSHFYSVFVDEDMQLATPTTHCQANGLANDAFLMLKPHANTASSPQSGRSGDEERGNAVQVGNVDDKKTVGNISSSECRPFQAACPNYSKNCSW